MAIHFDKELNSEIERTVRNFNAKVKYNKNKTRGKGMLPQKIYVQDIKDKYSDKSRKELLKQLKLYQSFGKRNALSLTKSKDTRLSEWEEKYFKTNLEKTKEFYDKEIADLKRIIGNKPEFYLKQHQRLGTLIGQREALDKDLSTLTETQIKGLRNYFNYAERSEIVKNKMFKHYLSQLNRAMDYLGYSKDDKEQIYSAFNQLSENEFTEMVREEDIIDRVYTLIDSPEERGEYELMAEEDDARYIINSIIEQTDYFIKKYKK